MRAASAASTSCCFDNRGFDQPAGAGGAQRRAFHHQRLGAGEDRALARLVVHLAVSLLQQARHRGGGEMRQPEIAAGVRDEDRRSAAGLGAGRKAFGKVHLDAEAARELRVFLLQFVILFARTDQDDLGIDIHRLGFQRNCRDRREGGARLFDLQPAAAQKAPQLLPHQRVGQQVAQMQHQETAVRPVQAAGADPGKIGHQHIVLGLVFDAAEQRAEQGVVFDDHRRAVQAVVVHDQVDPVAGQHGAQRLAPDILIGIGNLEQLQILQHVMHDLVQIGAELDRILDLLLQSDADLLKFVIQQRLHDLAPQGRQAPRSSTRSIGRVLSK